MPHLLIGLSNHPGFHAQSRYGRQVAILADDGALAEGERDGRELQIHSLDGASGAPELGG